MPNPFATILPGMKTKSPIAEEPAKQGGMMVYKKGTRRVPSTGKAKLHKGETVLGKKDARKYRKKVSGAAGTLGAGKSKTRSLLKAAGDEMKANPPKILAKTARKSGSKQAEKQRVAILLSKARQAGADIPEK